MMKARTVIEVVASLLIVLFLYSATTQAVTHGTFQSQINRSFVNGPLSIVLSWLVPAIQLLLAYLLWRPATRLAGLIGSFAAISCFTLFLVIMLPVAYKSACHCGEIWPGATVEVNILINLALILLTATAIILKGRYKTNSPRFS